MLLTANYYNIFTNMFSANNPADIFRVIFQIQEYDYN